MTVKSSSSPEHPTFFRSLKDGCSCRRALDVKLVVPLRGDQALQIKVRVISWHILSSSPEVQSREASLLRPQRVASTEVTRGDGVAICPRVILFSLTAALIRSVVFA